MVPMWVRAEYERLARDFPALAAQFGLTVDAALAHDLVELIGVFEAVDRRIDQLEDAAARAALTAAIVRALRDGSAIDSELDAQLAALRRLTAHGERARVSACVARFFACSEILRRTTDARAFVQAVLDEAAPACELTLLVAGRAVDAPFARCFARLSEVANLVDKLHDVRGDRRRGEIAVRAGARLHAALLAAFVDRCARMLWLSPRPLALVAWGARYLIPPPSDREPSRRPSA
jgi:hypothetical protein